LFPPAYSTNGSVISSFLKGLQYAVPRKLCVEPAE